MHCHMIFERFYCSKLLNFTDQDICTWVTKYPKQQQYPYNKIAHTIEPMQQNQTADDFLSFSHKFKLGCLLTEQQNPKTIGLSQMAKNNLPLAIQTIKEMDFDTMQILKSKLPEIQHMYKDVNETLESGGKVFVCGCGATGRLSLVLETLWRQQCIQKGLKEWQNRVVSFMAGGDAALIKSIEDFQDHPQFAQQQLVELGFKENDLLIGSTQGGQTSWVIGAVWKSTTITSRKPYILYGNTDKILVQNVQRSKQFIQSPKINKINCNVGYMALAGSTRMQSTTILMHAIGITLLGCDKLRALNNPGKSWIEYAHQNIDTFIGYLNQTDFSVIGKWIESETDLYQRKQHITYHTIPYYAISILTDTTERSPTFSLVAFPSKYFPIPEKVWCNMNLIHEKQRDLNSMKWEEIVENDWQKMLGDRQIRGLNSEYWKKYEHKVSNRVIMGFGMHETYDNRLEIKSVNPLVLEFFQKGQKKFEIKMPEYPQSCRLSHHSLLKILLNNASTLIMGRMDRYFSNIMTYVKPTNYKLIDRASRYVMILRPEFSYEQSVRMLYKIKPQLGPEEPVVLRIIHELESQKGQGKGHHMP